MENELKKIYNILSGGKTITRDDYIISRSHFNSISADRFISELRERGISWGGNDIAYSDLVSGNTENYIFNSSASFNSAIPNSEAATPMKTLHTGQIGIDIQDVNELPDTSDFWEDEFYISKFTPDEIAYCITKDNPKQSFAGLYSSKEALIKCDNNLKWENISIFHDKTGKPQFSDFNLSISHSGHYSVAVAFKFEKSNPIFAETINNEIQSKKLIATETTENSSTIKGQSNLLLYLLLILIIVYILFTDFVKL